ncbi:hypothetical protein DUI87_21461 [Hirundo rustica rustica]|uniref:PSI domain-containing protein n=1 Tax=Hirundo rustica rustica TaxID=333673 RepID=A0A3M0JMX3_HIRRU|nr:hypothetical protein DUI87_21461 [Hirundo rustica rustica]
MAPPLRLCALALALLPAALTAQDVAGDCRQYTNRSCEECLKNVTCLWCASSRKCVEYPVRRILPPADLCELRSARWGVCWDVASAWEQEGKVLCGPVQPFVVDESQQSSPLPLARHSVHHFWLFTWLLSQVGSWNQRPDKDDERAAREREKRRVRQEERRAEMKSRHDEIRRKYGLFKEENPYAKFEN